MSKIGRPTNDPKPNKITVRISNASKVALDTYGKSERLTQAEVIREITIPLLKTVKYKDGVVDELERAIISTNVISENYKDNKDKFERLQRALSPVLEDRSQALSTDEFDNLNLEGLAGTTIKKVYLDARAERLIQQAMGIQNELLKMMFK